MNEASIKLHALLGSYPNTMALKSGKVASPRIAFDFADVKVPNTAFKRVVRDLEFDVAELAIVTFLMAKAWGKPLVLVPAVVLGRFQHPFLMYNPARGKVEPNSLAQCRIGIRSYSVTTVAWIRGVLMNDYGLDIDRVRWVTFEDAHVAEFRDPPTAERAPAGKDIVSMLKAGEIDAAVLGEIPSPESGLKPVIPDPDAAAQDWCRRNRAIQVNHMVVVKPSLTVSHPDAVQEIYRLLLESKRAAAPAAGSGPDMHPFGVEANRRNLEIAIDYVHRQRLIPRRFEVDELFDDVTRALN